MRNEREGATRVQKIKGNGSETEAQRCKRKSRALGCTVLRTTCNIDPIFVSSSAVPIIS